jgi:hypothetical protein
MAINHQPHSYLACWSEGVRLDGRFILSTGMRETKLSCLCTVGNTMLVTYLYCYECFPVHAGPCCRLPLRLTVAPVAKGGSIQHRCCSIELVSSAKHMPTISIYHKIQPSQPAFSLAATSAIIVAKTPRAPLPTSLLSIIDLRGAVMARDDRSSERTAHWTDCRTALLVFVDSSNRGWTGFVEARYGRILSPVEMDAWILHLSVCRFLRRDFF